MGHKKHEIWALCVLTVTLLVLFSLLSFRASDLTLFNASSIQRPPLNWIGFLGAHIAWFFFFLFGLGAYGIPVFGAWVSWSLFRGRSSLPEGWIQALGMVLLLLSTISLVALHRPTIHLANQQIMAGGVIGRALADFLAQRLYSVGTHILLIGTFLIALLLATPLTLESLLRSARSFLASSLRTCSEMLTRMWDVFTSRIRREREPSPAAPSTVEKTDHRPVRVEVLLPPPDPEPLKIEKKTRKAPPLPDSDGGRQVCPSLDLLDSYEVENHKPDWKKLERDATTLEEKLADFGVQGKVVAISPGPVITMYEYTPAPGIKISRIVGLSDDLSMALRATSIRVVAPIPGKAAIGIELPNEKREIVSIRTVLESEAFRSSTAPLTIALGKDTTGQPVVANLARMPHLLIAGATGTGKSVCINTLLGSLLFRNSPDDIRLLLIDPKRIELKSYEGIPQLIHPVVTDAKMATRALRWAVSEMELRYRLLADKNVRNIEGYNRALAREKPPKLKSAEEQETEPALEHHRLPYIVVIIDELADLMMVASREVEESITRLAQMARAAGIHLILATQRPSVDVLTGIIKANIPTRISFQVSSRIDSRTIIDTSGAESLLGSGDMLFLPPGTAKLQRIHGAFISDGEVQRLTAFWKSQQLAVDPLRERVDFREESTADEVSEDELDDKYEEAVQLVIETRQASISMLQRRLRVGYNRAARMIEVMEQQGIVGASDGVKPREVLARRS